ncbi:MAG: outer membrane protein assembly factor BamD [Thermoanaerobaculia bacterium]
MKRHKTIAVAAATIVALAACHHGPKNYRPTVNPEFENQSKEQIFAKADDLYDHHKWSKARSYYSHIYENYPNDPLGRRSLLRVADTFFQQGDAVNLVEAQYKYRDFINRYPGSDRADYAMLQIANVSFKQMERPDRDQQKTRESIDKFNEMIRTYPRSPLRAEAEKNLNEALDRLAKHEHVVARFYIKRKSYLAAVQRLNFLVEQYPNYQDRDAVFYDLANALDHLGRKGEAKLYYERVVSEFPKSDYAGKAKRRLDQLKA